MGEILFLIAQSQFRDEELAIPKKILEDVGYKCKVASIEKKQCVGSKGLKIMPDMTAIEGNKKLMYFDVVVVVGGPGSPKLADYPEVLNILKRAKEKGKVIAGICLGPTVLAKSGVLAGKEATVFPEDWAIQALIDHGAKYNNRDVVTDGKFVTADGPKSSEKFGNAIIEAL